MDSNICEIANPTLSHQSVRGTKEDSNGAARYGTVRLSSGRFAFPLQFSTAIEWAGLFTRRYNRAASTAVTSS